MIWNKIDYIVLFILAFLPLLYKLFFWLYTIQLKEYRFDRFKEYLYTKQWKQALFNVFFIVELILLFYYIWVYFLVYTKNIYAIAFLGVWYNIFFYYLLFLNLFVIWKIVRKRILKPKITTRLLILLFLFIFWIVIDLFLFEKFNLWTFSFLYILFTFLLMPAILFFYNFLSLPIINYKKNKIINKAIKKSSQIWEKPVKIAITGSYWKSSTKEFLSSILEQKYNILKTPENINTELWVSSIVLHKLNKNYDFFIWEIWAYRIWEIKTLWKIVNHKYWFLTAIWNQHIWLFGSQENIIKWKFEILEKVIENNGFLYVNSDNKYIEEYLEKINTTNIIRYWINSQKACAKSTIIKIENIYTTFEFQYNWIKEIFKTNLIGEHNILNLTWILAFCYDIWLTSQELKKFLLNIKKPKDTQEIIEKNNNILINDTYNLSVDWLNSWINLLQYFENKQKILVLDDILELWKQAEEIHQKIAENIAKNNLVDKILFAWVNYKEIFINTLIKNWFKKENIINNIEKNISNSVLLFEWKKAWKYLDILKNS